MCMPKTKASASETKTARTQTTGSRTKGRRPRRSCASGVNYVEPSDDEDQEAPVRPADRRARNIPAPPSGRVKHAMENAGHLAILAARFVWGKTLKVKVPNQTTLKAQAMCGEYVPKAARAAMLDIWQPYHHIWREEHSNFEDIDEAEMEREIFVPGNAFIWLSTVEEKAEVKAFCVIEPETEKIGRGKTEDVVWLLHLYAHPDFDQYNLHPSLMDAVKEYCRASGILKNVAAAAPPLGEHTCSDNWIGLLKQEGFHLSKDTSGEHRHLLRYERTVSL